MRIWKISRFVSRGVRGNESSMEQLLDKVGEQPLKRMLVLHVVFLDTRFVVTNRIATKQNAAIFLVIY